MKFKKNIFSKAANHFNDTELNILSFKSSEPYLVNKFNNFIPKHTRIFVNLVILLFLEKYNSDPLLYYFYFIIADVIFCLNCFQ